MDGYWKAARAFAIVSIVVCGLVMLGMILLSCFPYPQWTLKVFSALAILGAISQSLIFLLFGSRLTDEPFHGSFFIGAGVTIVSICISLGSAAAILFVPTMQDAERARNVRVVARPTTTTNTSSTPSPSAPSHKRNFPAPPRPQQQQEQPAPTEAHTSAFAPGTETVTESVLPDGSKQVTTTRVEADGSRSSTVTVVRTETT